MSKSANIYSASAYKLEGPRTYFHNLDALRFVAFLFVFKGHAFAPALRRYSDDFLDYSIIKALYDFIILKGGLGVSFFFVLSGFLITFFLLREKEATGRINIKFFFIKRILRIWPLYFLVLLFAFVIYPFLSAQMGWAFPYCSNPVYYITFLSNFDVIQVINSCGLHTPFTMVMWSIAVQEQFYLVLPFIIKYSSRNFLKVFLFLLLALSTGFRAYYASDDAVSYYHTLSACGDLTFGCLVAYYIHFKPNLLHVCSSLNNSTKLLFYALGAGIVIFTANLESPTANTIFYRLSLNLFFSYVILNQTSITPPHQRKTYLTEWGKYTYGMYLLHVIAITALQEIAHKFNYDLYDLKNSIIIGTSALLLTLLASYLSFEYFENRFLSLKKHFVTPFQLPPEKINHR